MNPLRFAMSRYFSGSKSGHHRNRTNPQKARRQRLCLEALEDRTVPSAVSVADTTAIEGATEPKFLDRFVPAGSGGLSRPRSLIFGPDANGDGVPDLYIADRDLSAILRYDGVTGAYIDTFVGTGSGGLNQPGDLVFGSDGDLYVSSQAGNQILRYNSSGAFIDVIASGLSTPVGITFGSDGALYIANFGTNEVLRYNNSVLSTFVTAGSGGLTGPNDVKFGPDGNLYVQNASGVLRYNGQSGAFIDTFAGTVPGQGVGLWEAFGSDGYLYTTSRTTPSTLNTSLNRFNATTGAYVDTLSIGRDSWNFMVDSNNIIYYSGNGGANYIERYGHSSLAPFSVSLDAANTSAVTVTYATADGTAVAGTNYTAASGTVTIPAGMTSQTILVQTLDDGVVAANKTFTVKLSNPVGGTISRGQGTDTTIEGDSTKFYVVDAASTSKTYRYGINENAFASSTLASGDTAPRGMAASADGSTFWVVDKNKTVYVYDPSGNLLGSWSAGGLKGSAQVEGIASNGTDIWLLDRVNAKVYKYTGAASRRSGSQGAASSFSLSSTDSDAKGIVTDGTYFWVVDDGSTSDTVFKYTLSGTSLGSWTIDAANSSPTGLTINPNNVSDIWIVDSGTKTVYQYTAAASLTSGSRTAARSFALAAGNTNPQDIADPPVPGDLLAPAPIAKAPPLGVPLNAPASTAVSAVKTMPSLTGPDALWAMLGGELLKAANEPLFSFTPVNRALTLSLTPIEERPSDRPALLAPVSFGGAGSDPSAAEWQEDALATDDSQASTAAMDSFFAMLADQPISE
jgi:sugar lactone lactonase YvrE